MATSSLPSNFLPPQLKASPSRSIFFRKFHPQTHSLKSYSARKLGISCCQQIIQLDSETERSKNLVKKKRKQRPSFLEQVQSKWSLKIPSFRENFPWEVQESESTNKKFEQQCSSDVPPDKGNHQSSSVSDGVRPPTKIKSNLAPWVHGKQPRRDVIISEGVRTGPQHVRQKDRGLDGFHEHCQNEESSVSAIDGSDILVDEIPSDGKSERKCDEFGEIPSHLPEKIENLGSEESKGVSTVEDLSNVFQNVVSTQAYADTNDLDGLPWERKADEVHVKNDKLMDGNGNDLQRLSWEKKNDEEYVKNDKLMNLNANDLQRLPWEREADKEFVKNDNLRNRNSKLVERLIPENELKRLRNVSLRMVERIKVGAAGVTQALVDAIHEKWKDEEVVKLKFDGPPSKNMKRTHEFLESRTGGLVIWRSGSSVVLYRGMTYKLDCVKSYSKQDDSSPRMKAKSLNGSVGSSGLYNSNYFKNLSEEEQIGLSELNLLLDELGPRFIDWSGREPLPVDADLLPAAVPGCKTPFRLLPHGTRQALRDIEMTYLRRTARTMPPHFVLGRNRELQGLAIAMVKLWEKSAIAKIAIKRGVLNTNNERMAEELKILTGGTLISRNKEFIVFYRGNDFLPPHVSSALIEAEKRRTLQQDEEEQARHRAALLIDPKAKAFKQSLVAGTLAETFAATSRWGNRPNSLVMEKMMRDAAISRHASLINSLQKKLALAKSKIRKADQALQKVLQNQEPENLPTDLETLTDEERFLFRRIGLSMKPYLLLGRREIFDGTIENMHLHWKYRELVKIIVQRKTFAQVKHIAVSLEAESGGVLVSVDKTTKGYASVVYRGKNYQSPLAFRPRNLLTKRQALARSIELQRREALKHHIVELEEKLEKLKLERDEMVSENDKGDESSDSSANAECDDSHEDGEMLKKDFPL